MLRKFDAFARPIEGLSKTSTVGGIITITAYAAAAVLLLLQLVMYWNVETVQYLQMAKSQTVPSQLLQQQYMVLSKDAYQHIPAASQQQQRFASEVSTRMKIPVSFHVTFPHIPCQQLELAHDEARGEQFQKIHGQGSFQKYPPNAEEMKRAGITDVAQQRPDNNHNNNPSLANKLLSTKLMNKMAEKARLINACTIRGKIMIPKVGGVLSIGITPEAWQQVVLFVNTGLTSDGTAPKIMNVRYVHLLLLFFYLFIYLFIFRYCYTNTTFDNTYMIYYYFNHSTLYPKLAISFTTSNLEKHSHYHIIHFTTSSMYFPMKWV